MGSIWSDSNWGLILSLVLGSAVLAFLGDYLGYKYGKQRISLLGLRPRYTSHLITVFTGVFISILILTVMSFFSQNVRTALFSMKYIQQQLMELHVELQKSRSDTEQTTDELLSARNLLGEQRELLQTTSVSLDLTRLDLDSLRNERLLLTNEKNELEGAVKALRDESEELKHALDVLKLESIALHANHLLGQQLILPQSTREQVATNLETLKKTIRESISNAVSEKFLSYSYYDVSFDIDPAEEKNVMEKLISSSNRHYVRALCAENVALGEKIKIRLEYGSSFLIYKKGEPVYRKSFDPASLGIDSEKALHLFLRELKLKAIRDGVLPNPATNSVGTLDGEAFFDSVDQLKAIKGPVIINAVALQDIYTEGPVNIKIEFQE